MVAPFRALPRLAVLCVGLHLAVPLGCLQPRASRALVVASALLALLLVMLLAGFITPLVIPPDLIEPFTGRTCCSCRAEGELSTDSNRIS